MKYYKYDFNNRYYYLKVTSKDKVEVLRHDEYNINTYFEVIDSFKKNMDKAELISLKILNFELKKYTMMWELKK